MNPGHVLDGTTLEARNIPRIQQKLGIGSLLSRLPVGGLTGQSLTKVSDADFHVDWTTVGSGGGPADSVQVTIVAAENLPAYGPVTSLGLKADSANPSASFGRVIGLAPAAIANGFSGPVVEIGEVANPAWTWTAGDYIFLSGTSLATSPPGAGFVQRLGTAKNPTTIIVDISDAVLL